jgi:trans-2,3-dihydro-3-hydroxyanthranilate isomerase
MKSKKFIIADVFAEKRFGGNQLAVFTDGAGLDDQTMQDIAREMHFSETTFLFPPEQGGDYRVRIFTPESELPFAGHPIVGTAHVIVAERMKQLSEPMTRVTLEAGVGPILAEVNTEHGGAGRTTMNQPLPVVRGTFSDVESLARALSLDAQDIEQTGLPVEIIYNGIPVMVIPVASLAAVQRIKADAGALERISYNAEAKTILAFTRETVDPSNGAHCRVFAPSEGVPEDAATGSANGPLGFYMVRHRVVAPQPVTTIVSEQGFEMNRPSFLRIEVSVDAATEEVTGVRVGGGVIITGRGEILLS